MWVWTWPGAGAEEQQIMSEAFSQLSTATGISATQAKEGQASNVKIETKPLQPWQVDPGLEGYGWAGALYDSSAHPQYTRAVMTISDKLGPGGKYSDYDLRLATYLHELGHVAGLGHSNEGDTLMAPRIEGDNVEYTEKDKVALSTVREK